MLSLVLFAVSAYSYVAFHTVVELFAVVVALAAFGVGWYSRRWISTSILLMLGIGHLFVGVIDLLHLLFYKGMTATSGASVETAIEFWLIGRALEVAAFLIAAARPLANFSFPAVFAAFGTVTTALVALTALDAFPATFVEGEGLTSFKMGAEAVIIAGFMGAFVILRRRADVLDPTVRKLLMLCLAYKVAAELCFCVYTDPFGATNFLGHVLKVASYFMFLRAVVETGLIRPQAMIFGAIEREKDLTRELQHHANTLDAVLDASLDTVVMLDRDGRFLFVSRAGEALFGRPAAELVGKTWREAGLDVAVLGPIETMCRKVLETAAPATEEFRTPGDGPGRVRCLEAQVSPVRTTAPATPSAVVAVIRDISQRMGMEEVLQASLDDNRVLMMEVHHRVKNNLQIVSSLLQMQGWQVSDPAMREHFEESCGRILSLAKVHEMLYDEENVSSVDFVRYIRVLVDELFKMYEVRPGWITVKLDPGELTLPLDKAVPLALIAHELMAVAIRGAVARGGGELRLRAGREDGVGVLRVAGELPGPGGPSVEPKPQSLGMRMVEVLTKQVQGQLTQSRDGGGSVEVRFPLTGGAESVV